MPSSPRFVEMLTGPQRTGDHRNRRNGYLDSSRAESSIVPSLVAPFRRRRCRGDGPVRARRLQLLEHQTTTTTTAAPGTTSTTAAPVTTTLPPTAASIAQIKMAYSVLFDLANPAIAPKLAVVQDGPTLRAAFTTALKSPLAKSAAGASVSKVTILHGAGCRTEFPPQPVCKGHLQHPEPKRQGTTAERGRPGGISERQVARRQSDDLHAARARERRHRTARLLGLAALARTLARPDTRYRARKQLPGYVA